MVAEALGARNVPRNRGQIESYIDQIRPQLCFDQRTAEVLQLLLAAPSPNIATKPVAYLMARCRWFPPAFSSRQWVHPFWGRTG